jgi:hypothetical protein
MRLRAPDGWKLSSSEFTFHLDADESKAFSLAVTPPPAGSVRVYRNPLDLSFEANALRWTVTAGLVTTTPWLRWPLEKVAEECPDPPDDAEMIEQAGHFQPLPNDPHAFAAEFKLPYNHTLRYIVQAPREVGIWLDGEEINYHDGSYLVPAIHRARETGKDVKLRRGWHRLTIAVGEGEGGDLFFGIGDGESWDWLRDAEWRPISVDRA